MAIITKTTNTFQSIQVAAVIASGSLGTRVVLDLRNKDGAYIHCMIGRQIATALTRSAYVAIRKTDDDTLVIPNPQYDVVSQTVVAIATTLSAGASIGDGTISVASASGLVEGHILCLSGASAARPEFCRIVSISGTTLTLEAPLRVAHNSGDDVRNLADAFTQWIPGGDKYAIRCINNSGQSLLFQVDAEVESGYTST